MTDRSAERKGAGRFAPAQRRLADPDVDLGARQKDGETVQREGPGDGAVDRRTALKVLAASAALAGAPACTTGGDEEGTGTDAAHTRLSGFDPVPPSNPLAAGTPTDPDLLAPVVPWEPVLGEGEMETVRALCDLILPGDDRSPAASAVGVPDYVNEYVSAPYPGQQDDLVLVRGGLAWLNRESQGRFGGVFAALSEDQQRAICDPIRYEPEAPDDLEVQARFFDRFRDITSTGFWTTDEGMRDLGYVGNVPLPSFEGPPPEVVEALGLTPEDLT